jgi:CheY-like chemotaxis protein
MASADARGIVEQVDQPARLSIPMTGEAERTVHILVVEDDQDVRDAVLEVLEDEGFLAAGVANGFEALAYLGNPMRPPDLILLDLIMPHMDGFQFREAQLKNPRLANIPVAVFTAHELAENKAAQLGASGFVRKPLKIGALLDLIEQALGNQQGCSRAAAD